MNDRFLFDSSTLGVFRQAIFLLPTSQQAEGNLRRTITLGWYDFDNIDSKLESLDDSWWSLTCSGWFLVHP